MKIKAKLLERPIFYSTLTLWLTLLATWLLASVYLDSSVTHLFWSQSSSVSGVLILVGVLFSLIITSAVWKLNTLTARTEEYVHQFEKEIEAERLKTLHAAKLTSLGNMAAGIAHEINNPLAIIVGKAINTQKNLSLQPIEAIDLEKAKDSVQNILKQSDRISHIIKSLKSMTADGSREEFQLVSLKEIIFQARQFIQSKFEIEQIEFLFQESEDFMVYCRPIEITQIFYNLFSNSFDALQDMKIRWIHVSIEKSGHDIEVIFSDSGGPLDEKIVAQLFEPFYTTKDVGKGTGLGLSVSYSLAQRNKAEFFYDKEAPTTTFRLRFLHQT